MGNPFEQEYFTNIPDEKIEQIYRNQRLKLPFDPKDLVMFLDRGAKGTPEEKARRLRTIPYHHRSADLGVTTPIHERFPMKDGEPGMHHVYTQFDIKGSGFVYPEEHESKKHGLEKGGLAGAKEVHFVPNSKETSYGYDFLGLMDLNMALFTKEAAKDLAKHGMRTEAIAGIYKINSIKIDGEDVSVEQVKSQAAKRLKQLVDDAKSSGEKRMYRVYKTKYEHLISGAYEPVVEVRCMRSVMRIRDFNDAPQEFRRDMINEAVKSLNIEMEY